MWCRQEGKWHWADQFLIWLHYKPITDPVGVTVAGETQDDTDKLFTSVYVQCNLKYQLSHFKYTIANTMYTNTFK